MCVIPIVSFFPPKDSWFSFLFLMRWAYVFDNVLLECLRGCERCVNRTLVCDLSTRPTREKMKRQ
jgi:hypothetical protein